MKEFIKIHKSKKRLDGEFRLIQFQENETFIYFLPSLNISGYGDTIKEAQEMLNITVEDYFKELIKLPDHVIMKELEQFGWKRDSIFKKKLKHLSDTTFEDIKKQFNIPDSVEIRESRMAY